MQLKSIRLIAVELTQPLQVTTDTKSQYNDWEIMPDFMIGFNEQNKLIQNIEVTAIRTIGNQRAKIKVMTSLELEVNSPEYLPSTDQDFVEFASWQQIAIAHTRALFLRETRGTKFANQIIPVDNLFNAMQKVRFSRFNQGRMN